MIVVAVLYVALHSLRLHSRNTTVLLLLPAYGTYNNTDEMIA